MGIVGAHKRRWPLTMVVLASLLASTLASVQGAAQEVSEEQASARNASTEVEQQQVGEATQGQEGEDQGGTTGASTGVEQQQVVTEAASSRWPGRTKIDLKAEDDVSFYLGDKKKSAFVCAGECSVWLPPGRYRLSLRRGLGDLVQANRLEVTEQPATVYGIHQPGSSGAGLAVSLVGVSLGLTSTLVGLQQTYSYGGNEDFGVGLLLGGGAITAISVLVGVVSGTGDKAQIRTGQFVF